ncbi:hypothetical protein BDF19DRAFT_421348 [Syncephalis fuscata]|nr:hypothetical protein BDF19DRAFT_421348 [Syncephalis fuscata]
MFIQSIIYLGNALLCATTKTLLGYCSLGLSTPVSVSQSEKTPTPSCSNNSTIPSIDSNINTPSNAPTSNNITVTLRTGLQRDCGRTWMWAWIIRVDLNDTCDTRQI